MSKFQNQVRDFVAFSENLNFKSWVSRMLIFQRKKLVEKFGRTTSRFWSFWSFWSSISGTTKLLNYVISKNDLQKSKVYSLDPIQFQGEPKELSKVLMSLANSPSTRHHPFLYRKVISFDWCCLGFFILLIYTHTE